MGEGWGKWGQSTSNLTRGRTVPVTAGGRQVSERGVKGIARGARGGWRRCKEETTPCIYVIVNAQKRMIED